MRDYLDRFEELLEQTPSSKKRMALVGGIALLFILFYFFYVVDALERYQSTQEEIEKTRKSVARNSPKRYLAKVVQEKRKLLENKAKLDSKKMELLAIESRFRQNRFLLSDMKDFNLFLESLLGRSVLHDIDIENLVIDESQSDFVGKLKKIRSVDIDAKGRFLDVVSFLRSIERTKILMLVNDLSIETNGSVPRVDIHIDFYGAKQ